jgi:hypothetical protein
MTATVDFARTMAEQLRLWTSERQDEWWVSCRPRPEGRQILEPGTLVEMLPPHRYAGRVVHIVASGVTWDWVAADGGVYRVPGSLLRVAQGDADGE